MEMLGFQDVVEEKNINSSEQELRLSWPFGNYGEGNAALIHCGGEW